MPRLRTPGGLLIDFMDDLTGGHGCLIYSIICIIFIILIIFGNTNSYQPPQSYAPAPAQPITAPQRTPTPLPTATSPVPGCLQPSQVDSRMAYQKPICVYGEIWYGDIWGDLSEIADPVERCAYHYGAARPDCLRLRDAYNLFPQMGDGECWIVRGTVGLYTGCSDPNSCFFLRVTDGEPCD